MIQIVYKRGKGPSTDDPRHHPSLDSPGKSRYFYAFLCQVQFLSVSRFHRPAAGLYSDSSSSIPPRAIRLFEGMKAQPELQTNARFKSFGCHPPPVGEAEQWINLLDPMVSRAIPFPPIEAQPSEALPTDPFKAFLRVKRTSDSRSNDSPGTLHQLWIRSQPSPFSTQQPLGPFMLGVLTSSAPSTPTLQSKTFG